MVTTLEAFTALCQYEISLPFEITQNSSQQRGDVTVQDITFTSRSGNRIDAYLVIPSGAGKHPGIVWGHWLELNHPTSNRTQFLEEAVQLAVENDAVSLLPQMPWHGEMLELFWKHDAQTDIQTSAEYVIDFRRCLDLLIAREDVDPNHLLFVGHDFSGMYGTLMGAIDRRPQAYVLMAVTSHFKHWFRFGSKDKLTPEALEAYGAAIEVLDVTHYAGRLAPSPVFLQFGRDDFFVPDEDAERYFAHTSQPKQMTWYGGEHHLDEVARQDRIVWLKEHL